MSKDIEKYTNWRAITESDYVTMFIKTWFAFVATLRELYPDISVFAEDGKPRGDRPFTNTKIVHFDKQKQNKTSVIVLFALTCAYCYVKIYMIKN